MLTTLVVSSNVLHNDTVCVLVNTFIKHDSSVATLSLININSRKYGFQNVTIQNVGIFKIMTIPDHFFSIKLFKDGRHEDLS